MSKRQIEAVIGDPDALAAAVVGRLNSFAERSLVEEFADTVERRLTAQCGVRPMPVPVMLPLR